MTWSCSRRRTCGWAASGRNGGFCAASLTHGLSNGLARYPDELATLDRLGAQNLDDLEKAVLRYGIDCDFHRSGELTVATEAYQVPLIAAEVSAARSFGHDVELLGADAVRAEVASPTYLAGAWQRDRTALVDPARLAWGLRAACLSLGVRLYENTPVDRLRRSGAGVTLTTAHGQVRAAHVVLGTNAFPGLLRRMRPFTVPVYDYVLVTEPLSAA